MILASILGFAMAGTMVYLEYRKWQLLNLIPEHVERACPSHQLPNIAKDTIVTISRSLKAMHHSFQNLRSHEAMKAIRNEYNVQAQALQWTYAQTHPSHFTWPHLLRCALEEENKHLSYALFHTLPKILNLTSEINPKTSDTVTMDDLLLTLSPQLTIQQWNACRDFLAQQNIPGFLTRTWPTKNCRPATALIRQCLINLAHKGHDAEIVSFRHTIRQSFPFRSETVRACWNDSYFMQRKGAPLLCNAPLYHNRSP